MVMNELFDSRHECMYINYIYDIILITFLHKNNLMANNNEFKEEIIDLVKPKWYDNKYLWFFGGIIMTSGAVYLAGLIN